MDYFRVNYKKLERLPQYNYWIFIVIIIIIFIIFIVIAFKVTINKSETFYGVYTDNILKFKIQIELSDKLKNNKNITFNNQNVSYEIIGFEDYEIIDNKIYQVVDLKIDKDFYQNEVGKVKLYYGKEKLIAYIFELFNS